MIEIYRTFQNNRLDFTWFSIGSFWIIHREIVIVEETDEKAYSFCHCVLTLYDPLTHWSMRISHWANMPGLPGMFICWSCVTRAKKVKDAWLLIKRFLINGYPNHTPPYSFLGTLPNYFIHLSDPIQGPGFLIQYDPD